MVALYLVSFVFLDPESLQFVLEGFLVEDFFFIHHNGICNKDLYSRKGFRQRLWINVGRDRKQAR